MIYIQTSEGLTQVSSSLTKEKIIAALGYTPADGATFYEDGSGELVIADPQGYIIAKIAADGFTSTKISAEAIVLKGEDLAAKLESLSNIDLSGYATEEYVNEAIAGIDAGDIDLSKYALAADVAADKMITDTHMSDEIIHITEVDRQTWNGKSDFSGAYADLSGAPHIVNDNEDEVVICDSQGNIILRATAEGLNAANIYANGDAVVTQSILNGGYSLNNKKILILGDSINAGSSWKNGYANILLEEFPGAIVANNAQSGKTLANNGIYDELILAQQAEFSPDYILINGGINDLVRSVAIGTVSTDYDTASLDVATMVGGFEHLIINAQTIAPNAKIIFLNTQKNTGVNLATQTSAWEEIEKACKKYGVVYVDIFNQGNYNHYVAAQKNSFTTDGIHLTEAGYRRFWPMIKNALMNA